MGMKRLAAVVLVVAGVMVPACAQRGGSHGGFSGHGAAVSRGGLTGPVSGRFAGSTGSGGSHFVSRPGGYPGYTAGVSRYRPPYTGSWRYRRPYENPYRSGIRYVYPGWAGAYLAGYPYDIGYDNSQAPQDNGSEGYAAQPDEQGPLDANYPPYPAYQAPPAQQVPSSAENEDAVTLVFKDGRAPEQIRNYVLTSKTLYVGDLHRREIPIDDLDLTATAKVNHDAGVDFHLPNSSN
jgi:hypothetical protein